MTARRTTDADVDRVTEILVRAFDRDPLWSWVFDDPAVRAAQLGYLWRLSVDGARRYDTVWIAADGVAASVWIPPGGSELSDAQEHELDAYAAAQPTRTGSRLALAVEQLDAHHPTDRPHHYLSLLATHPDERGRGHGLALLAENLAAIDAAHEPAYLESSNPANVPRYEAHGFRPVDLIDFPDGGPVVTTMWRDAR